LSFESGIADVMVQATAMALTDSALVGMLPFAVVTFGIHEPQVGVLVRVHVIEVPSNLASSAILQGD